MSALDPAHVQWSENMFRSLADGGTWGIPRSGLMFQRRGEELLLTDRMPWEAGMMYSAAELARFQADDFEGVREHMGAAGITVLDVHSSAYGQGAAAAAKSNGQGSQSESES